MSAMRSGSTVCSAVRNGPSASSANHVCDSLFMRPVWQQSGYFRPMSARVLVLTPMKNAASHLDRYFTNLAALDYDPAHISLGFLVSDSDDGTLDALTARRDELELAYRDVTVVSRDFGLSLPQGVDRWSPAYQIPRRIVLARSRNHLLFAALRDEDWVLWMDVDLWAYPSTVLTDLLATGKSIVHPHCVVAPGSRTFDGNSWFAGGKRTLHDARDRDLIRLEGVGGTMLLVRADIHRDGLVFPAYPYGIRSPFVRDANPITGPLGGELETEGLAVMAKDMGHEVWGMPNLEIVHEAQ